MFISQIEIKNHYQFKDFKLDLTYPAGHKKAGQPLDKVCFIGQSGTGKTTLLEEIWDPHLSIKKSYRTTPIVRKEDEDGINIFDLEKNSNLPDKRVYFNVKNNNFLSTRDRETFENQGFYVYSLNIRDKKNGWEKIENAIRQHQNEKVKYSNAIANAYINNDKAAADEYVRKLHQWEKENETPLDDLASTYLNPILSNFNLEVKTVLETLEEVEQIHLTNKTTLDTIPIDHWSTGIQNLITRTIPLYTNQFKNAVICIDEPENSLYPDIQRELIDIYTQLAPKSQFFFATHSPIIASSFEPWEIVELKFNQEGYVYREEYYEGERHVDNYKYDPRYLRWDAILQHIFDLENDGSDDRKEMLYEFAQLDNHLKQRKKKEGNLKKDDKEVQQLMKMGRQLGWNIK